MKDKLVASNLLVLVFAFLMLSSCQNDEDQIPNIPENQFIDVNKDGKDDFQVNYYFGIINSPTSTEGIICTFKILDDNERLSKVGQPLLFLRNTDDISNDVVDPLEWNSVNAHLASFENHFGKWPEKWDLATNEINKTYFIGVKLNNSNTTEIGWIEFEIDDRTGNLNVLKTKIL